MFEMAKDQVIESGNYELLAGYYSPVSDQYKKEGLVQAVHRVRMCECVAPVNTLTQTCCGSLVELAHGRCVGVAPG